MKFCSRCGKEIHDDAVICVHCGCSTGNANVQKQEDTVSIGLCILSFLIPLFGIIYWPVKHKDTPKRAKACGLTGIITWAVFFLFYLFVFMIALATA